MTDRPYELLVHTRAPLARNEALYRSLASAYLDFTSKDSPEPEDEEEQESYVVEQRGSMADSNAGTQSQLAEHNTLQAFMLPDGQDSWTPDSQLSIPQKSYLTRSKLATSSAAPPAAAAASFPATSQSSFVSTFPSTLDGMHSPRFRMPALRPENQEAYQWPSQTQSSRISGSITKSFDTTHATPKWADPTPTPRLSVSSEATSGFVPPPNTVQDSQSPFRNPLPVMTSQLVMESFLAHFDSHTNTSMSSPSVKRSQTQRTNMTSGSGESISRNGSSAPQDGQLPADSSFGSNQSSIRSGGLDDGRQAPLVSPPEPRRQRQPSPSKDHPSTSRSSKSASQSNGQALPQPSQTPSAADRVSPAPSNGDEEPAPTLTSVANTQPRHRADPTAQWENNRRAPLPIPDHVLTASTATPTPPDTPTHEPQKRKAATTPLQDSSSRPPKKVTTQFARIQEASDVLRTPVSAAAPAVRAWPQVPFTGSFNLPAPAHHLSRVRNASFDEGISRISDTPPVAPSKGKLPVSKPPLPLTTSISVVPDTPTPVLAPVPQQAPVQPSSSTLPLPSAPPSSALTSTKPPRPQSSSTRPLLSYEIHPPPPIPSNLPLTTFITPFLTKIASQMSYSRYDPASVTRPLRKDERGYWSLTLPDDVGGWSEKLREETWKYLEKIVAKGRVGWGVHMYRALWSGDKTTSEAGWRGEEWRVYCWGEIVGQVYLLLFLASSRRVRGLGARWVDGGGEVVVWMGRERRVKEGGK